MGKLMDTFEATVFCGIDVSAATLAVAVIEHDQPPQQRQFANRASGIAVGKLGTATVTLDELQKSFRSQ